MWQAALLFLSLSHAIRLMNGQRDDLAMLSPLVSLFRSSGTSPELSFVILSPCRFPFLLLRIRRGGGGIFTPGEGVPSVLFSCPGSPQVGG